MGANAKLRARDVMTPGTEFAGLDETVADVAKKMKNKDVGALPVCGEDRHLQGMLTDRDIVLSVVATGKDPATVKVADIAPRHEVVTIGADDSVEEALRTMKDHQVRRLPVIDGTEVVGMISQGDLALRLQPAEAGKLVGAISA